MEKQMMSELERKTIKLSIYQKANRDPELKAKLVAMHQKNQQQNPKN